MPRPWQVIRWREGDIRFGDSEGYKREETEGAADVVGRGHRGADSGCQFVSNFRLRPPDPIRLELGFGAR